MESTALVERTGDLNALRVALSAVERDPGLRESTKRQYRKAVVNAAEAGVNLTDPEALNKYAASVGSSTRGFLSAVITKLTEEIETRAKARATPIGHRSSRYTFSNSPAFLRRRTSLPHKAHVGFGEGATPGCNPSRA